MHEIAIEHALFVLPPDVMIVPVRSLSAAIRRQVDAQDDDFAVSRPRMRRPSKVLDRSSAGLLQEFRSASTIVEAVLRYSRCHALDPHETLERAFEALQSLVAGEILVPEGSEAAHAIEASFVAGMCAGELEIVRLVQGLEDSELYEALTSRGERVALKVLRAQASAGARQMFDREVEMLQHLDGVSAPRLRARGAAGEVQFVALEWIAGTNVDSAATRLRCAGEWSLLHQLCRRVLSAFSDLHRRGVVHGDVHPGNILVRTDGSVVVLDYARSRRIDVSEPQPSPPRAGICYFYEPEMAASLIAGCVPPDASPEGEQYALAALVYYLLAGQHYQDFSLEQERLLHQVASLPPLPFASRGAAPWPAVESVLATALRKGPGDRFDSVAAFADAFRRSAPRHAPARRGASSFADAFLRELDFSSAVFTTGVSNAPRSSLASGSTGIGYLLYRACLIRDDPHLLARADAWAERAAADGGSSPNGRAGSAFHGAAGLHFTRASIARARHDRNAWRGAIRDFLKAVEGDDGSSDFLDGSSGALAAAAELYAKPLGDNAVLERELQQWIRRTLRGLPLASPIDGVAHGAAGQLYAALRASQAIGEPPSDSARDRVEQLARQPCPEWPGWCRGAAGMIHLWAIALEFELDSERRDRFRALGNRDALRCWSAADRHPDLCCGLAGRALALLRWYRHTGDGEWLRRARNLARRAERSARFAEHPYSLLKGTAGIALLHVELEAPETAAMPLFG